MYIKARQWIRETFERKSRPTLAQVEQWVADGDVPGRHFGGELYIDDAFATHVPNRVKPPAGIDLLR